MVERRRAKDGLATPPLPAVTLRAVEPNAVFFEHQLDGATNLLLAFTGGDAADRDRFRTEVGADRTQRSG